MADDGGARGGRGPLSGLRVIDAASMVMVPSAAVVMADFGAEVIKIEPPEGDLNRYGHHIPGMPDHDIEYCFLQDNRSKRSLALDLKEEDGREVLWELVKTADVFFTNVRPKALAGLGIDYPTLSELNPRLIYAHGTGYGDRGEETDKPGFDAVCYWSRSALELTMFPLDGWLGPITYGSGDHPSGMSLLSAVLMALYRRERTGKGGRVTTSLIANGAWSNSIVIQARLIDAQFHQRRPRENPINFAAVYYLSADQRPFKFTIINHQQGWPKLCRAVGRPDLIEEPRFATVEARAEVTGELVAIFDQEFATQSLDYWKRSFEQNDVPFSALSSYDDVIDDPQMHANDVFVEVDDPEHGKLRTVNNPLQLEGEERAKPRPAPRLGEHSREILVELGLTLEEIGALMDRGVVKQADPLR